MSARKKAEKVRPEDEVAAEDREHPELAVTSRTEAVVEAARDLRKAKEPKRVVLSTGAKATLHPVSPALLQDVQTRIKDPPVPNWFNPDKDRNEPNPMDPSYLAALEEAASQRVGAIMDAMIMFGVELDEGSKPNKTWLKRLKRLGFEFDEKDPDEVEFLFKKYGTTTAMMAELSVMSGVSAEGVQEFRRFLSSDEGRGTDS